MSGSIKNYNSEEWFIIKREIFMLVSIKFVVAFKFSESRVHIK